MSEIDELGKAALCAIPTHKKIRLVNQKNRKEKYLRAHGRVSTTRFAAWCLCCVLKYVSFKLVQSREERVLYEVVFA